MTEVIDKLEESHKRDMEIVREALRILQRRGIEVYLARKSEEKESPRPAPELPKGIDAAIVLAKNLQRGSDVRRVRNLAGIKTQSEFARLCDVSQPLVSLWEGNEHCPNEESRNKIVLGLMTLRDRRRAG